MNEQDGDYVADIDEDDGTQSSETLSDFGVAILVQGNCSKFLVREGESAEYARWDLAQEIKRKIEEGLQAFNEEWEMMDFHISDMQIQSVPHRL